MYNISMSEEIKTPDNLEIEKALKEFEAKAQAEQAQKAPEVIVVPKKGVAGVSFETDSYKAVKFYSETDTPRMVRLVMKWSGGAIKDQKQAEYVLFGLVIIMLALSFYFFFGGSNKSSQPSAEQLKQMNDMMLRNVK
jgi:hypothetical protein